MRALALAAFPADTAAGKAATPAPADEAVEPMVDASAPATAAGEQPILVKADASTQASTPAIAPVLKPAPAPVPTKEALNEVVAEQGLNWVETDPERFAAAQARLAAAQPVVRLGRARKTVAPVASEPLAQVETVESSQT